ncbi:hypothetical protein RHMOL_Rhmol01G0132800 [Rhododendron molle]|uniref:Uncharacterized protein n=1 Tax=Rhododendron molle TaxID=49168 RepID=A0ACC0Q1A0_RHOML|nr:hypothetical protein RHMOL_Rhmol01G0132800 [Rhododendron molle]
MMDVEEGGLVGHDLQIELGQTIGCNDIEVNAIQGCGGQKTAVGRGFGNGHTSCIMLNHCQHRHTGLLTTRPLFSLSCALASLLKMPIKATSTSHCLVPQCCSMQFASFESLLTL